MKTRGSPTGMPTSISAGVEKLDVAHDGRVLCSVGGKIVVRSNAGSAAFSMSIMDIRRSIRPASHNTAS